MTAPHRNGSEPNYWGYLIRHDKSASPHLEQLCLGLARIICSLEPGPTDRLTPRRLAAFYKSLGGNLDPIFLRTSESGLSFLYRTIGCFHSLEPSSSPFKEPSMPCLTPDGFVKWQTVQLLLCPQEHVRYLQEAVRLYDVPRPDGGFFPKSIPNESLPNKPDAEMDAWHKKVTAQLTQDNYMRQRIKNSPHPSPHPTDGPDGYFSQPIPKIRRPSRPGRQDSRDGDLAYHYSRRSSEPDRSVPMTPAEYARSQYAYRDGGRSTSSNRPVPGSRQRSATTGDPVRLTRPSDSSSRNSNRPPSSFNRGHLPDRPGHPSGRSPSGSSTAESSADDASSEDSRGQHRSRRLRATSGLLSVLPFSTPWHKRARSHDASYRKDRVSPRRDGHDTPPPLRASTETFQRPPPSVRFRHDMFDNSSANSAPESPAFEQRSQSGHRPNLRYGRSPSGPGLTDPVSPVNYNLTRETSSGSGSEHRSAYEIPTRQLRKAGASLRSPAVTGVQGRKYAGVDSSREGPMSPASLSGPSQQDPRNPMRYSLAV